MIRKIKILRQNNSVPYNMSSKAPAKSCLIKNIPMIILSSFALFISEQNPTGKGRHPNASKE